MNPVKLSQLLQDTLVRYLATTFNVNRDGQEEDLAYALESSFATPGALFNGPYLELTPPYLTGCTLEQLCDDAILTSRLKDLECFERGLPLPLDAPLFRHQEIAIRNLCAEGRNVVVSSGTGSGKTECFLIPILHDILTDPDPGVRALLIYPMNALVNDQLERLRSLLWGTSITFGRYTSELPETMRDVVGREHLPNEVICREQIRTGQKLPQILVTNYAMLEYLLLRPEDSILFSQGAWRFIVLDEAHTYTGAKGVEVGMLLRRLKHRLHHEKGETTCIATSATLTNDDASEAVKFASDLFGEPFDTNDIIFGEIHEDYLQQETEVYSVQPEAYVNDSFDSLLAAIRAENGADVANVALKMVDIGLLDKSQLNYADIHPDEIQSFLWNTLRNNNDLITLREWMLSRRDTPVAVSEAADYLFHDKLPSEDRTRALYHLVELGALARPAADRPPLLPARYHLFARAPLGIWVCLNPYCQGRESSEAAGWSRISAIHRKTCDACGCAMYPLYICRTCGQVYIRAEVQEQTLFSEAGLLDESQPHYFTWTAIAENLALAETEDDEDELAARQETGLHQAKQVICLRCRRFENQCRCDIASAVHRQVYLVQRQQGNKKRPGFTRSEPVTELNECCRCHDKSTIRGSEIVTPISMTGLTPLSIVTSELYRQLPPSSQEDVRLKPGEGRKLLSFYDSRQGAARFAAFLQDSVNSQTYRHLIPKAADEFCQQKKYWPDLDALSERVVELAWQARVFHNDPSLEHFGSQRNLSRAQRDRLRQVINRQIIAEFTTGRRSRQSLESLGILAVEYFEPENAPDFESLASRLGMSEGQAQALIGHLLDALRTSKVITLPEGVNRDDEIFGRNQFSPRLVRANPNVARQEVAWIGATARHRRREYTRTVLEHCGVPATESAVEAALDHTFRWLIQCTDLLFGSSVDGYQLDHGRIFFHPEAEWSRCMRCHRLSPRGVDLPCPHPNCGEVLEPVDIEVVKKDDFFYHLFQRNVIPMRVEEHTAQLDSEKGRDYQDGFKSGSINVLSCSTTFEMGIDLGDLQAIVMSNMPPAVANYRQRAGRAGRRAGGTAFILTWASDRPHDQTYFNTPAEIISGHVHVPYLALENHLIRQRHVNAILLSAFLRHLRAQNALELSRVGPFFDPQSPGGAHYDSLNTWLEHYRDDIGNQLIGFASSLDGDTKEIGEWIETFRSDMRNKAQDHYLAVSTYYREQIKAIAQSTLASGGVISAEMNQEQERHRRLLSRLDQGYLIDYLSAKGVLPSYSFPLYTIELALPPEVGEHLRLERDLRQAIREYAPGSEVVADKRLWRSAGLQFYRETPNLWHYRICSSCNYLEIGKDAGIPVRQNGDACSICGSSSRRGSGRFVVPDGFQADPRSGKPAGQYVRRESNAIRSAVRPRSVIDEEQLSTLVRYTYERDGELLYVNEGINGRGFKICLKCGRNLNHNERKCTAKYRGKSCPGTPVEVVMLGHRMQTDILHLSFVPTTDVPVPGPDDLPFWVSLMYALLQGASRRLQIERRDIDGVLSPRSIDGHGTWQQTIALYDNVPGGAGHVRHIQQEFLSVIEEAVRITSCVDCAPETACYHCLRDYSNQTYHHILERGRVLRFLEALKASLSEGFGDVQGASLVAAMNRPRWLIQQIDQSTQLLVMAADRITRATPLGENRMWLEVIQDLLQRNVEVHLLLTSLPTTDTYDLENLSIARHLQLLLERRDNPLRLWHVSHLPSWHMFVDPVVQTPVQRSICMTRCEEIVLDDQTGQSGMLTTIHTAGIDALYEELDALNRHAVTVEELSPPSGVTVLNLPRRAVAADNERTLFGELFTIPVMELLVNDRYLYDQERILNRLAAYIELAQVGNSLQRVTVRTLRAGKGGVPGNSKEQTLAIEKLNRRFNNLVHFEFGCAEHDRYVVLRRVDGTQARILIGKGLDFIDSDGRILSTYVVIEDPFTGG